MIYKIYRKIYHIIFKGFAQKKCKKSINRSAAIGQCQSFTKFVTIHTNFTFGGKFYPLGIKFQFCSQVKVISNIGISTLNTLQLVYFGPERGL